MPAKTDNQDMIALIASTGDRFNEINAQRKELNEEAEELRQELEKRGVDRKAFNNAYAFIKGKEERRAAFDAGYMLCRKALGAPVQDDLFNPDVMAQIVAENVPAEDDDETEDAEPEPTPTEEAASRPAPTPESALQA